MHRSLIAIVTVPPPPPPLSAPLNDIEAASGSFALYGLLLGLLSIATVVTVAGFHYANEIKQKEQQQAMARFEQLDVDWRSDLEIAMATSRATLAGPILKLREHEEQIVRLQTPSCLSKGKAAYKAYMRSTIQSLTSFMASRQNAATTHMSAAGKQLATFKQSRSFVSVQGV